MMEIAYTEHRKAKKIGKFLHRIGWFLQKIGMNYLVEKLKRHILWIDSLMYLNHDWWMTQGEHVKIALLDTGIDQKHPALKKAIKGIANFTDDLTPQDHNGHGTHCAGIIAASSKGKYGFRGLAPKAELYVGKVINDDGEGCVEWVVAGLEWALENEVDIVSMSMTCSYASDNLYRTIKKLLAEGICIICPAGNDGRMAENGIGYPGKFESVITIGAHDQHGRPSGFSSVGGEVDFLAPGVKIWSTYKDKSYAELSGTSMAVPFVAGLSALIISKHKAFKQKGEPVYTPINNNEDLKSHLLRMAAHPGYYNQESGYGPLLPFRYIGIDPPENHDLGVNINYLYRRKGELQHEIDDRVDLCELESRDFWKEFLSRYPGRFWRDKYYKSLQRKLQAQAQATVLIFSQSELSRSTPLSDYSVKTISYTERIKLHLRLDGADLEVDHMIRFASQRTIAGFTGFLVAPDLVMTCAHGIRKLKEDSGEKGIRILFNYFLNGKEKPIEQYRCKSTDLFHCEEIMAMSDIDFKYEDWAIIRLSKKAKVSPLLLDFPENTDDLPKGTELYMIGYPLGAPVKLVTDARILWKADKEHYQSNLDAFCGNSGSPVFCSKTFQLAGILVKGRENSYKIDSYPPRMIPRIGDDHTGRELIQRISTPMKALKRLLPSSFNQVPMELKQPYAYLAPPNQGEGLELSVMCPWDQTYNLAVLNILPSNGSATREAELRLLAPAGTPQFQVNEQAKPFEPGASENLIRVTTYNLDGTKIGHSIIELAHADVNSRDTHSPHVYLVKNRATQKFEVHTLIPTYADYEVDTDAVTQTVVSADLIKIDIPMIESEGYTSTLPQEVEKEIDGTFEGEVQVIISHPGKPIAKGKAMAVHAGDKDNLDIG